MVTMVDPVSMVITMSLGWPTVSIVTMVRLDWPTVSMVTKVSWVGPQFQCDHDEVGLDHGSFPY